jgi:hypothetical protein
MVGGGVKNTMSGFYFLKERRMDCRYVLNFSFCEQSYHLIFLMACRMHELRIIRRLLDHDNPGSCHEGRKSLRLRIFISFVAQVCAYLILVS